MNTKIEYAANKNKAIKQVPKTADGESIDGTVEETTDIHDLTITQFFEETEQTEVATPDTATDIL